MPGEQAQLQGEALTDAISASMVRLYSQFYGHNRTSASTFINQNVVVCLLENIFSTQEGNQVASGASAQVIDGRVAFQSATQDEFTQEIERLTGRDVVAFMSANQTDPGIACELFYLETAGSEDQGPE